MGKIGNHCFSRREGLLFILLIVSCTVFGLTCHFAQAEDLTVIDLIPAVRKSNYIVKSPDGVLTFQVAKGTSTASVSFKLLSLVSQTAIASSTYVLPEKTEAASDIYFLDISTSSDWSFIPRVIMSYPGDSNLRNIYYWNDADNQFRKLDSIKDLKKYTATADIAFPGKLIFVLLKEVESVGRASWYVHPKYRQELMAASTQFSWGAKVLVTNLANGKQVVVTIKDWGPDPAVHPDRVIDLGKEAFKKIASTRMGVIDVKVEPYQNPTATVAVNKQ
ncbi:MAG: septal ring lytic transglycosylase RlpA family protein [Patescibacteria group bacterium]